MMKVIHKTGKLLIIIAMIFAVISCTRRKGDVSRSDTIPSDKFKDIIEDIYITKGLMFFPSVQQRFTPRDSASAYDQVIESHGYTRASFDKTIKYYYVKKPKQLIKIYDEVLARLSEMESRYSVESNHLKKQDSNLWRGLDSFISPGFEGSTEFSVNLPSPGVYTISFTLTLYPDDESFKPSLVGYTVHPDSLLTGKRHYLRSLPYLRDGKAHDYSLYVRNTTQGSLTLTGNFFSSGSNPGTSVSHYIMEDVSVSNRAD